MYWTSKRQDEIDSRHKEFPSAPEVVQFGRRLSSRLWERHTDDDEFLALRVGRAEQSSRTTIQLPTSGSRVMMDEMAAIPPPYARIPDLPAVANLFNVGGIGIAGPLQSANRLGRSLIVQLAGLHSPSEVILAALLGKQEALVWKWLSWLPHLRSSVSPIRGSHLGTDASTCDQLVTELADEIGERNKTLDRQSQDARLYEPTIVVLIDEGVPLDRIRLSSILKSGPPVGVYFIWIGSTRSRLPRDCVAVVDFQARTGDVTLGFRHTGHEIGSVDVEGLSLRDADAFARELSPVIEIGGREGDTASVPTTVGLVEMLGGTAVLDDPAFIIDRWTEGDQSIKQGRRLQLRAPIGSMGEAPLSIDIRQDGPHALVAGTTGAGKSELLQTYIASLAVTHNAQRITFLLVDYKGGAAFKDCVYLPHVVGLVTDLNPSEVRRALVSLEAELRYRELILNEASAKDLVELETKGYANTPPSLVLVVDEFAALAKEVPEFVEGVVDVALRGRSLGIHLVLATQRPAGVITPQIRANTNLRIALRVADNEDSTDIIGIKQAALIDPAIPGRGIAKLGPRKTVVFQSAYVGGFTQDTATGPQLEIATLDYDRPVALNWECGAAPAQDAESPTDLQRLVANVVRAHRISGSADPRLPWQPPIADTYDLARLRRSVNDQAITIGVSDLPHEQRQAMVRFRPDIHGNLIVIGASGSGKTVLLRTIAASAALSRSGPTTHIYGLDFAGRGLEMLSDLPHVGSIVLGHDDEYVVRLLRDLRTRIDERSARFAAVRAGSLPEYRMAADGRAEEPRIMVLLDGYSSFHSTYERVEGGRWIDWLTRLVGDGRQFGVHFILTADRRTAFPLGLASAVPARIVLRLASQDDYSASGIPSNMLSDASPPGRAVFGGLETQIALLGGGVSGEAQMQAMSSLADYLQGRVRVPVEPVRVLPEQVDLATLVRRREGVTFGVRDIDLGPAILPLDTGPFLVAGPPRSGKTTALEALLVGARSMVTRAVVVGSHPSQLTRSRPRCQVAVGEEAGTKLLQKVIDRNASQVLVVVDDLHEFGHTPVEDSLLALLRVARDRRLHIVISADVEAARRAYDGGLKQIRSSKCGLLLQPDHSVDGDVVGIRLPRTNATAWPPGRGYLALRGIYELVQVAFVST